MLADAALTQYGDKVSSRHRRCVASPPVVGTGLAHATVSQVLGCFIHDVHDLVHTGDGSHKGILVGEMRDRRC
jgi:hypothetical protein